MRPTWDEFYLSLARFVATRSRDPSTKVGAVVVDARHRISIGFNGFPQGVDDDPARYADREVKYAHVVHAEANAIIKAGDTARGATMYVTLFPCAECAKLIIQSGVKRVVSPPPEEHRAGPWSYDTVEKLFREGGVTLTQQKDEADGD